MATPSAGADLRQQANRGKVQAALELPFSAMVWSTAPLSRNSTLPVRAMLAGAFVAFTVAVSVTLSPGLAGFGDVVGTVIAEHRHPIKRRIVLGEIHPALGISPYSLETKADYQTAVVNQIIGCQPNWFGC